MTNRQSFKLWCAFLVAALVGVMICIRWLDIPIARAFLTNTNRLTGLAAGLSSAIFVAGEIFLIVGLAMVRLTRGTLPEFAKAILVASCASLSAFLTNDYALKFIFGRHTPSGLFHTVPHHVFNFFQGNRHSSFPAGHMVMAAAFGVTLIQLQPRALPIVVILLGIGATGLMIGDWHFVGDIIAGAFFGGTVGLVVGKLWLDHAQHGLA
jgi:hypothetical protein